MADIFKLADYLGDLEIIGAKGFPRGPHPGWTSVEPLYRPHLGYMTTVTGIPGHGKSEWLDCMLINIAWRYGLKFVYFSPENFPVALHAVKLIEKVAGLPFKEQTKAGWREAATWLDEHFTFLYPSEEECTLPDILRLVAQVGDTYGAHGFVIDPWNEIDHKRPEGMSETEYISQSLTRVRRFAREKMMHAWIVAHPMKLQKNKDSKSYDPPTPYDISGSAHWRNKSDFCITCHRHDMSKDEMTVYVNKVKFKHFGKIGKTEMDYDCKAGRLKDKEESIYRLPEKVKR